MLELHATDFVLTGGPPGTVPPTPDQNVFLVVLAGWRREINPLWSTELRGGLTTLIRSSASTVYVPTGSAQVGYKRLTWNATLTASQEPLPNLFSGQATINDSVLVHLTLPLGRTEQWVLTGAGGYVYARVADVDGTLRHTYDQRTVLSLLSYRFLNAPLFLSLSYSFVDQRGGASDLQRHVVMLNLTGLFMWGPGTPPVFGGGGL